MDVLPSPKSHKYVKSSPVDLFVKGTVNGIFPGVAVGGVYVVCVFCTGGVGIVNQEYEPPPPPPPGP